MRITGMVICRNEAARIAACLASLDFCDEIVVVDSGSTDGTLDLIRRTKARLFERPFRMWGDQKEYGRTVSTGTWVLNIDADEVVSAPLRAEIEEALRAAPDGVSAYRIPFKNHFRGVWIRRGGYYPDHHVRLLRRERARWDTERVHEQVHVDGETRTLRSPIEHYSFDSVSDYVGKLATYSESFARTAYANGRRTSAAGILGHTAFRFFKSYVLQGAFLEGALGLMVAGFQAYEVFQKYVRLWELDQFPESRPPHAS